ncbi:MAG: hypothetical protein WEA36_07150 [Balneolaceae bacterium]
MIILSSIIFFHLLTIFLAKMVQSERTPWLSVLFLTLGMTCCVLYLLYRMQPPDMGV